MRWLGPGITAPARGNVGESPRWKDQNIILRPWRERGEEILILPQRGFGPKEVAMPEGWVEPTVATIKRKTSRPVRVRKHPGNHRLRFRLRKIDTTRGRS